MKNENLGDTVNPTADQHGHHWYPLSVLLYMSLLVSLMPKHHSVLIIGGVLCFNHSSMISTLVCALLAQSTFPSINSRHLPPSKSDFWFVALGDNRPAGPGLPPTHTFRELLQEIGTIGPEFILSSGDLLYGNEETLGQYKQEIAWMKPLIATLPCPFFNAPGNHEINNRQDFYTAYTNAFGASYGSFDFGGFRFVAVCTELPAEKPSIFGAQLAWLKKTLNAQLPAVVFQHHPVFVRESNSEKETAHVDQSAMIHKIYLQGGVKMVVEGHDHIYNAQVHDGIDYRISGGAGAPMDGDPEEGGFHHFLLIHAHDGKLDPTVVPSGTLEILPLHDGVEAVCNYANIDLPLTNLLIKTRFKPASVAAVYTTKKKKSVSVEAAIRSTRKIDGGYETQIALVAPRAHATIIKLMP